MRKIKKLAICASALCAVVGAAGMLGACGEENYDYENLTVSQFAAISESYWDSKTISYQVVTGDMEDPDGPDHGNRNILLFNFYEDGAVVIWQAGLYTTSEGMTDAAWVDQDRFISWVYYGVWETTANDTLKLYIFTTTVKDASLTIEKSDSWADNAGCYIYEFTKEGDNYVMDNANLTSPFLTLGFNSMAEEWSSTEKYTASTTIQYNTVQSWIDKYLEDNDGTWTEI